MAVFRLTDFLTHAARQFLDFGDARLRHPQVHLLKAQFFGALYIGFLPLCCRDSHVLKKSSQRPNFCFASHDENKS